MSKLNLTQLSVAIDASPKTIDIWYKWKRENPDNEIAKLLPDYEQSGARQTRYWNSEDVDKFAEFRANIVKGRNGILGSVTQKYVKKKGGQ